MLAIVVALIFLSTGGQLDRGKSHLQDLGCVEIFTKRAGIEGRGGGALGPVKVVSSSSAMEDVQPGCS